MHVWLLVSTNNIILYIIIYFFYKDYLCFFINFIDYSRYIYYFSKPWGFVCICMCVIIMNVF